MPLLFSCIAPHPPLIVPEIGKGQEKEIQKTIDAYEELGSAVAAFKPETIVVISPHSILYSDYIHISPGKTASGDFARFGAKGVKLIKPYDTEFVNALCDLAGQAGLPAGTEGERDPALDHGTLVPLSFVEHYLSDYKLVRISISGLGVMDHYRLGELIRQAADQLGRRVVLIASGDLSHKLEEDGPYGYAKEGPEFDRQITDAMAKGDFMGFLTFDEAFCDAAAECGLRSFIEMAGALDGLAVSPRFLSYEGTFGVGYAVCVYEIGEPDESRHFGELYEKAELENLEEIARNEDEYVKLARLSLETTVREHHRLKRPEGLPQEMTDNRAGVFVSLKKEGSLRGCIGTIAPTKESIADEIIHNAVSAGREDPRFDPVTEDELPFLVYSVDVLKAPEPINSIDELNVKNYGVIVTHGVKRGLLLPNLEGIDTPEQQVAIALQKAGIRDGQEYSMERFEVVRHR